jgi:hypothetical protein
LNCRTRWAWCGPAHLHENQHAAAELERVQPGLVAQDVAVALQALGARQHGGGRERHRFGQLEVGDAPVGLQSVQDAQVDAVEFRRIVAHGW